MRRSAILFAALLGSIGCGSEAPVATETAPPQPELRRVRDDDTGNLAAMTNGGSVVSRTAESDLEQSAAHAIDGATYTRWVSPPGDANMSAVYSLAARSRISRVGIIPWETDAQSPGRVEFQLSPDGTSWSDAVVIEPRPGSAPTFASVTGEATYVRVSVIEPTEPIAQIRSILVEGTHTTTPTAARFEGCWTLNGRETQVSTSGARLQGMIADDTGMFLDGGVDGRTARVMWFRGPMWGYGLATTAANENTLTLATVHEEILLGSFGRAWIGARCAGKTDRQSAPTVERMLDVAGRWSMFGLVFNAQDEFAAEPSSPTLDTLVAYLTQSRQRHRIVSREFRETTPEANRRRAGMRLAALRTALEERGVDLSRIDFVAAGSDSAVIESDHAIMRLLSSRMDLERLAN